ncbi:hypothetical protein F4559_003719 [Saccharothrix violaceirubra]|uniref:Uncharacterized protein n=1 Tax=Saccharothrix violaceirubra TaxID=413306 RepID=A0A7W7T6Z6_9PSEU|nr:hypothetical protein [Saccharothrix violaceirubra]
MTHTIHLRPDQFLRAMRDAGHHSDYAISKTMGVTRCRAAL